MIGTSNQSVPEMAIEPGFLGPAGRALWVLRTDEPRKLTQSSEEKRNQLAHTTCPGMPSGSKSNKDSAWIGYLLREAGVL